MEAAGHGRRAWRSLLGESGLVTNLRGAATRARIRCRFFGSAPRASCRSSLHASDRNHRRRRSSRPATRCSRRSFERDERFEGVFVTAVVTTGIFCRPTCSARKPKPKNVEFYATPRDALVAGYRPCRRCRPLRPAGTTPDWLAPLLEAVEDDPTRRWRDADLRELGLEPARVRRWFQSHHGMTFHAYSRARRLGEAIGHIQEGRQVSRTAYEAGYESLSGFNEALKQLAGRAPASLRGRARRHRPAAGHAARPDDRRRRPTGTSYCSSSPTAGRFRPSSSGSRNGSTPSSFPGEDEVLDELDGAARRLLRRRAPRLRPAARDLGHAVPGAGLGRAAEIPPGTVCSYGDVAARDRPAHGDPRRGSRQRRQPDRDPHPLPPRDRRRRLAHRVRRRAVAEEAAARGGRAERARGRHVPSRRGAPADGAALGANRRVFRPRRSAASFHFVRIFSRSFVPGHVRSA